MDTSTVLTIIGAILGNTVVLAGIAALWRYWSSRSVDRREHKQQVELSTLQSIIKTQDKLVQNLIDTNNKLVNEVEPLFSRVLQDKTRMDDIVGDIEKDITALNRQVDNNQQQGVRLHDMVAMALKKRINGDTDKDTESD